MEKRYQIFVSSTYADLREERQRVIQTLMEMDCIPSGMELFPAADEEQWEFIRRIIDDCDYYLLIIGGRYGSTTSTGVSYTEKEYDYAIEKGIKVVALLHENPDDIPLGKSEVEPEARGKLKAFRDKVAKNRLVKFWNTAGELPGLVALSLSKTIKTYPAVGWTRANQASTTQTLSELNELRKSKESLESELAHMRNSYTPKIQSLASLEEKLSVSVDRLSVRKTLEISWGDIFALLAPHLVVGPSDYVVRMLLSSLLFTNGSSTKDDHASLEEKTYQTIMIQFQALNLVELEVRPVSNGQAYLLWSLTEHGSSQMLSLCAVKAKETIT